MAIPGSTREADVVVGVDADINQPSLAQSQAKIAAAIGKGAEQGAKLLNDTVAKNMAKVSAAIGQSLGKTTTSFKSASKAGDRYQASLTALERANIRFGKAVEATLESIRVQQSVIAKAASAERQGAIKNRIAADRIQQLQLQDSINASKQQVANTIAEGNQRNTHLRIAGQQRVQIVRSVLETTARLEKATGAVISGFARTAVGAVSKTFSTIGSLFSRGDRTFVSSLSTSMSSREKILRDSFSRQERTLSSSVSRQSSQLRELSRTSVQVQEITRSTQAGVLGSVNRLGLGGLAGGIGAVGAIASTFTIGADFARGLAVLDAQLDLTDDQLAKVRQASIDLGNDLTLPGVSALDAAQAIQLLSKQFAGLGPAASAAATAAAKGTLQLARATGVAAEDAAGVVGAAVNVFGISADKAVEVADSIAAALKNAAGVSFQDFALAFKQGASVFETFVGPAESAQDTLTEFNTALAAMAKNALIGSDAGTSLKEFFLQANRGAKDSDKALAQLAERAGVAGSVFFDENQAARPFSVTLDILRKGLVGLTDEQRANTLQTIFGSDATRAANALLGLTTEQYAKLTDSVREQGLAAKVAAAQNTGLKGALDAAKSVLETVQILLFEKVNVGLGNFVLGLTGVINTILFGGSAAMELLRKGLLGVAAGMAAVVAAKGAIEALSLLGRIIALALTPFGALLAVAGLVGGAIAIMLDRSVKLRQTFGLLGDRIGDIASRVGKDLHEALEAVASFIDSTIIPAVDRAASFLADHLVGAFDATVRFITQTAIPGLERFALFIGRNVVAGVKLAADFITGTALPALRSFAGFVTGTVVPALVSGAKFVAGIFLTVKDSVLNFLAPLKPLIQPAIDGFIRLGSAIAGAVGGDFSKLGSGAFGALKGVGSAIANLAKSALSGLEDVGKSVLAFLQNLFTFKNFSMVFGVFLDVVEKIGEILGSIVSNPKFLAVVGAVGVAAVQIGFHFIKGFAEGVISNIPRLLKDVGSLIVDNLLDPKIIGIAILGILAGVKILALVRTASAAMGAVAGQGFTTGLTSVTAGAGGFLRGLFGGPLASTKAAFAREMSGSLAEITDVQSRLRVLGSAQFPLVNSANVAEAKAVLGKLEGALSSAELRGLQFRDRMSSYFGSVGKIVGGGAGIVKGIGQIGKAFGGAALDLVKGSVKGVSDEIGRLLTGANGLAAYKSAGSATSFAFVDRFKTNIRAAGATIRDGFSQAIAGLKGIASSAGSLVGRLFANTAKTAMATVLSVGAFQAGKQGGAGAGLLTGLSGFILGPEVGILTTSVGLLGAALRHTGDDAEAAKARIQGYVEFIKDHLPDGAKAGESAVTLLNDALAGAGDEGSDFSKKIIEALGPEGLKRLVDSGKTIQDVVTAFKQGQAAVEALAFPDGFKQGNSPFAFASAGPGLKLLQAYHDLSSAAGDYAVQLEAINGLHASIFGGARGALGGAAPNTAANQQRVPDFFPGRTNQQDHRQRVPDFFPGAGADGANAHVVTINTRPAVTAMDSLTSAINQTNTAATTARNALDHLLNFDAGAGSTSIAVDQAIIAVAGLGQRIQEELAKGTSVGSAQANELKRTLGDQIAGAIQAGVDEGLVVDPNTARFVSQGILDAALDGVTDATLRQQITDTFNTAIANVQPVIDAQNATTAATKYQADFQAFLTANPALQEVSIDVATAAFEQSKQDVVTDAAGIGGQFMDGVIAGIDSKKDALNTRIAQVGTDMEFHLRTKLQVSSPSKVTTEIGGFVMQGLIDGISDGSASLGDILAQTIDDAIAQAVSAANRGASDLQIAGNKLFAAFVGPNSSSSIQLGTGTLTLAVNSLFDSLFAQLQTAFDVNGTKPGDRTAAQRDIAGESPTSLNPADVLGARNQAAFREALAAIADLGTQLVAQGAPAQEVADQLHDQIALLVSMGESLGFNGDEIRSLVAALGLGDDSLASFVATVGDVSIAVQAASRAAAAAAVAAQAAAAAAAQAAADAQDLSDFIDHQFPQLATGIATSAQLLAFLQNHGVDLSGLGALGLTLESLAAMSLPDLVAFLRSLGLHLPDFPGSDGPPPNDTGAGDPGSDGGGGSDTTTSDPFIQELNRRIPTQITNIFNLPSGDPAALALAVNNQQARMAQVPGS